ncbi:rCG42763 [Rattus norvegicus]|uniref:RCG42763 n=1 Tax=Rattus norvegicus TaxID=10116 RepID=A6K1L3_RAT|nr:rCG42763 [Rattus norvegicus]
MGRSGQWAQHPSLTPLPPFPCTEMAGAEVVGCIPPETGDVPPTGVLQGPLRPPPWLTSNLLMNSEKMPKKASEVVALESSPKKASAFPSSSMASRCSPSNARRAGCAVSRKDYRILVKETAPGALPSLSGL